MQKIIIFTTALVFSSFYSFSEAQQVKAENQSPVQIGDGSTVIYNNPFIDIQKLVADAIKAFDFRTDTRHRFDAETIKNLTTAVTALSEGETKAKPSEIQKTFQALRKGNFNQALALFEAESSHFKKKAKKEAEIQRNIGALAFFSDTQKSLKAYRRATQLDPDDGEGWIQLGHALRCMEKLDEAIEIYKTALSLGEKHKNKLEIATAYEGIGNVYKIRGNLDKLIEYHGKAIKIIVFSN